jgi:hypothetical protein|eukprot:TRINITY_DN10457_c0_g1_i1.p2 TRINITY_DN10457_c0_g1~~TRINITY_DN10457_c0_g1_i1.p2  ORF type:complete len:221 (-),score=127.58 TRINITY_DN10457_c0_g1_i1:65-727(-)
MRLSLALLCLLAAPLAAVALQFDVPVDKTRCLGEEIVAGELVVGDFFVFKEKWHPSGDDTSLTYVDLKITDPNGGEVYARPKATEAGRFTFKGALTGDHEFCFTAYLRQDATVPEHYALIRRRVALHLRVGLEAKDYSNVAKKENLKPLEVEIRKVLDRAATINAMVDEMKVREEEMRTLNEETNSRVMWFSLLSIAALVTLSVFQVYSLKSFFIKKKLI